MKAFESYKQEAKEKWGKTDEYRLYEEKTGAYTKQTWDQLAEEMDRIMARFALCMKNGAAPDSAEAQSLVKCLQSHITDHYYPCTDEILAGLGQMYVTDQRFANNINKHADGTAAFICQAITICCSRS